MRLTTREARVTGVSAARSRGVPELARVLLSLALLVPALLGMPAPAAAQGWPPATTAIAFDPIDAARGQPKGYITALVQDGRGFVWIGTNEGLVRYDGQQSVLYEYGAEGPHTLPNGFIRSLMADAEGRIWIGTNSGGLAVYEPAIGAVRRIPGGVGGIAGTLVSALAPDGADGVWVGTKEGLQRLDASGAVSRAPGAVGVDPVRALLRDRSGTLWIGMEAGLYAWAPGLPEPSRIETGSLAAITAFAEEGGIVWIGGGDGGLWSVRADRPGEPARPARLRLPAGPGRGVTAIAAGGDGRLWIATAGAGLFLLDPASGDVTSIRADSQAGAGLSDDWVQALLRDRSGLVWVGTRRGLDRHDPRARAFHTLPEPAAGQPVANLDVMGMVARRGGGFWIGAGSRGLQLLPDVTRRPDPDPRLAGEVLLAFHEEPDGTLYAGGDGGLFRLDPGAAVAEPVELPGAPAVRALLMEGDALWVGTLSGLVRLDRRSGEARLLTHDPGDPASLSDNRVRVLRRDPGGRLWIGTEAGLNLKAADADRFRRVPLGGGTGGENVTSMQADREGRLWVGTYGAGIHVIGPGGGAGAEPAPVLRVDRARGLPHDNVCTLLLDMDGNVWASTDAGLARIAPATLEVQAFDRADGLRIESYWTDAGARAANGDLLFGGVGGVTVVRPPLVTPWRYEAPLAVTEIAVGGRPVPPEAGRDAPLEISPADRGFSVRFAALDFSAPERNRYAYRLEGFDEDWIAARADQRVAVYSNLPPGAYRLLVRGTNRVGQWTEAPLALSIRVLPSWYQTLWFRGALLLAGLMVVAGLVQGRTAYLRRRQEELERQVRQRTAELADQRDQLMRTLEELRLTKDNLVQHEKLASLGQLVAGIAHEVNTPVGIIVSAASHLEEELSTIQASLGDGKLTKSQLKRFIGAADDAAGLITKNAQRSAELIRSFKQVAADRTSEEARAIDLGPYLEDVMHTISPLLRESRVAWSSSVPPGILLVTHPGLLAQVVTNLVQNAVVHAFPGVAAPAIELAVTEEPDCVCLHLRDNGAGMPPEVTARAFDPFFTTRRGRGGTGLGLHIVHNIVHGPLGGRIRLDSEPGRGTTFTLQLPRPVPAPALESAGAHPAL
ncbi:MAG TPA: two-component regulator propeller domain-containing protein [Azospirillaceae bacterium]|nr:two-component regulator propeller domain-containing protein [Azospirillaceae bacterium]